MLVWVALSVLMGVLPLAGIGELFANGLSFTVGGLFMTLILLAMSGIFFQSAVAGVRQRNGAGRLHPRPRSWSRSTRRSPDP